MLACDWRSDFALGGGGVRGYTLCMHRFLRPLLACVLAACGGAIDSEGTAAVGADGAADSMDAVSASDGPNSDARETTGESDSACTSPTGCVARWPTSHNYDGLCPGGPQCSAGQLCVSVQPQFSPEGKCIPVPTACMGLGIQTCDCLAQYPEPASCSCEDNASSQVAILCQ
jgi:hypothetical protein